MTDPITATVTRMKLDATNAAQLHERRFKWLLRTREILMGMALALVLMIYGPLVFFWFGVAMLVVIGCVVYAPAVLRRRIGE